MLSVVSIFSVLIGTVGAAVAEHLPAYNKAIETCAGVLLITGFATAGSFLPVAL
jgi:hypothetical protein